MQNKPELYNTVNKAAVICGSGEAPLKVLQALDHFRCPKLAIGIKGVTPVALTHSSEETAWVGLGEIGKLISILKVHKVTHACFIGAVKRPSLFNLKLDKLGRTLMMRYIKQVSGDDSLLRIIASTLEEHGIAVVGAHQLAPNLLLTAADFTTSITPNAQEKISIRTGYKAAKTLGELDIGQSVIVQENVVIAVEAAEGTDKLIKRSKKLLKARKGSPILVKVKKERQDQRLDLPTIGKKTLVNCYKAGIKGVVIEKDSTLVLNQGELVDYANKKGMWLLTIDSDNGLPNG